MLIKKLISYCITFETNKYIYKIVNCVDVDCKSDIRQGRA